MATRRADYLVATPGAGHMAPKIRSTGKYAELGLPVRSAQSWIPQGFWGYQPVDLKLTPGDGPFIAPTPSSVHVCGEAGIMADASSHARFALIDSAARQLSIPRRRVEPPARALAFPDAARNDARTRHAPSTKRARTVGKGIAQGAAAATVNLGVAHADAAAKQANTATGLTASLTD